MRKIVVMMFTSLDGVIQAPGRRDEDPSGNFKYGGWIAPHLDKTLGGEINKQMSQEFDLLLGKKTYEMFASYWPSRKEEGRELNNATKYVIGGGQLKTNWQTTIQIKGDAVAEVKKLKAQDGPMLQVYGSSNMLQTLLANDLVDEFWLKIFPVILGKGKRLFGNGTKPAELKLAYHKVSPSGVIIANYTRDGQVKTGDIA